MKRINIYIIIILSVFFSTSCEDYLDRIEASDLTEEDVFGTYADMQGFTDQLYDDVISYFNHANTCSYNYGDHVIANKDVMTTTYWDKGNYWAWYTNSTKSIFHEDDDGIYHGMWDSSWRGIRVANMVLDKIDLLVEATETERNVILGQAYFFRGFFHWEIIKNFGGMPYIDKLLAPDDNLKLPRLNYRESTLKIVEDMDKAIELLPADWDVAGIESISPGMGRGRATKGAALGIKAKALLFAASPLMNNESTGSGYVYEHELLKEAADAAWELMKLADAGVYSLQDVANYSDNFYTMDGTLLFGQEVIWEKTMESASRQGRAGFKNQGIGRLHAGPRFGFVDNCEAPTENIIEKYEMISGLPIDDPASGFDPANPWANRDPRFDLTILTDSTKWIIKYPDDDPKAYTQLYEGGLDKGILASRSGYLVKKFWPLGANEDDKAYELYWNNVPILRMAEIYLIYAEAVNEVYGPTAAPNINGESGITAAQSVNIVRARVGMPDVHSKFTGNKDDFAKRILNERDIELCFEGHRWLDLRRLHIGHLPENKALYGNNFDSQHTYFNKVWLMDRIFDEKHYWMPLPKDQVLLYPECAQNPGW